MRLKLVANFKAKEYNKGKTSGSKVAFIKEENKKISIHKPHPSNILKPYQINEIIKKLKEMEDF